MNQELLRARRPISVAANELLAILSSGERWRREDLTPLLDVPSRAVETLVRELRLAGIPVMAGESRQDAGYWIEEDPAKFGTFVARRKSALVESASLIQAMESTEERMVIERGLPPVQTRMAV